MPATDTLETELMDLIFLNLAFDNIGNATGIGGSGVAGNLELSLHTGTLTDASNQNTTEADYTGYLRQDVARAGTQWTNATGTVTNDAIIQFGEKTAGTDDSVTDFGIGSDVIANELWIYGALTGGGLTVSNGVNPQFAASDLSISLT